MAMKVKEKKVELIELFYDLIYVYAISKMTLVLEEPLHGEITPEPMFVYFTSSLVIIQAWVSMTRYVNYYATWRWYEYVLVMINMFAVVMMSNTVSKDYLEGSLAFTASMILMTACVAILYLIQVRTNKENTSTARYLLRTQLAVIVIFAASLLVNISGYREESLIINVFAIAVAFVVPFLKHNEDDLKILSLPHLIERLELLTIITFGEGIVGITGFFTITEFEDVSIFVFAIVILMFGSYVTQVHYLCNHHQVARTNAIILSHYLIIVAINMVTVGLLYFESLEMDHQFTAMLMVGSLALFHVFLFTTSRYYHEGFAFTWKDWVISILIMAVGALIVFGFMESPYGFLVGSVSIAGGNFILLLHKYKANRSVYVINANEDR